MNNTAKILILPLVIMGLGTACSGRSFSRRTNAALQQDIPFIEAGMVPGAIEKDGLTIAAEVVSKREQKTLFARKITSEGFSPVLLTITNDSSRRFLVRGASAKLILPEEQEAAANGIDPIESSIGFSYKRFYGLPTNPIGVNALADRMETMRNILAKRALNTVVLDSRTTKRGFIFFRKRDMKASKKSENARLLLPIETLDEIDRFDIEVPITIQK